MTDLRTAAQQALEALNSIDVGYRSPSGDPLEVSFDEVKCEAAIAALRAALAQEQAEPDAYGYASRLATSIWERHYKGEAPNWKPLDDLMGVLTQIDNMTTGLTRQGQEQAEPVAWLYEAGTDRTLHWQKPPLYGTPLYTTPPQRQPLTDDEIFAIENDIPDDVVSDRHWTIWYARAVERAHGIIEPQIKVDSHRTLDDAMRLPRAMAQAYERGYKAGQAHERERIIQFLQEMQRVVGDAHNHYGVAAVRIKERV